VSSRSRAAANLAHHLTDKIAIPVRISWDNPAGQPGRNAWLITWTDGPTVTTMRSHAEDLVRYHRPLTIDMLHFSRFTTRHAWAAAMLHLAHRGHLPQHPVHAVAAAEYELYDTDTADWAHLWSHAGHLIQQANEDLHTVAALVHATVTKPCHETPPDTCQHCAAPITPTGTGRPARHCSPACRQAAHRNRDAVTKPSHETTCATCSRTFTPSRAGRPARHCSPACRTRAWRQSKTRSH
jgi:hypothetical protein